LSLRWKMRYERVFSIVKKETREFLKDKIGLITTILVPISMMLIFGFGLKLDVKKVPIGVLDFDKSYLSREIINKISSNEEYFRLKRYFSSYKEVDEALKNGDVRAVVVFPFKFEENFKKGRGTFQTLIDGMFPYRAETIKSYIEAVVLKENLSYFKKKGLNSPVEIKPRYWFNESLNQDYLVAVGTLAVVLAISPAVFSALLIVKEKESGSIYNIYVSPVRKFEYLSGKLLFGFLVSSFNYFILVILLFFLFKVPFKGSLLLFFMSSFLFILVSVSFGLLLSVFFRSQAAAFIGTVVFTIVPSILYTGFLTPISSFDSQALVTAHLIPTFYYLRILKALFFKAAPFYLIAPDMLVLLAFFVSIFSLNVVLFKKRER